MSLRIKMKKDLKDSSFALTDAMPISDDRLGDIAKTMVEAYKDTIDYEGENELDSLNEIKRLMDGFYGNYLPNHSFMLTDENDNIKSVVFLTRFKGEDTITYLFTKPTYQNQGNASALLDTVISSLHDEGIENLFLYVNKKNEHAISLYKSKGFIEVPIIPDKVETYLEETLERELP